MRKVSERKAIIHIALSIFVTVAMYWITEMLLQYYGIILTELPKIISVLAVEVVILSVFIMVNLTEKTYPVAGMFFAIIISFILLGILIILTELIIGRTMGIIIMAVLIILELILLLPRMLRNS